MIVIESRRTQARGAEPRRGDGKARLRANSLKDGTDAAPSEAFRIRAAEWRAVLNPVGPTQEWMADQVARITLAIDHAAEVDQALRDGLAKRAETCWDLDRRLEAESLARDIARRPGEVVAGLLRTVQGCDFLIGRWAMLAHLADVNGTWDEPQARMAFDLLGTPIELRGADPSIQVDEDGHVVPQPDGLAGFARSQIAAIRSTRESLQPLDDSDRESTSLGLIETPTPELRRSRRHEATLQSRLKWFLNQFKGERPAVASPTPPRPKPAAPPPPPPVEEDEDEFDDRDDEPTDEEMVAWFRAEAIKAGFDDVDALVPSKAERDQLRKGALPTV